MPDVGANWSIDDDSGTDGSAGEGRGLTVEPGEPVGAKGKGTTEDGLVKTRDSSFRVMGPEVIATGIGKFLELEGGKTVGGRARHHWTRALVELGSLKPPLPSERAYWNRGQ